MSEPKHCYKCSKLAKIGTPGMVRVPFNGSIIQLKVETPLCSKCIGELIRPFGERTEPVVGQTGELRGRMRRIIDAGSSKKWLGKRR